MTRVALGGREFTRYPLTCRVLQGNPLANVSIFKWPLAQLVCNFGLGCHQDTDIQLYLLLSGHQDIIPENLTEGLAAMVGWLKKSQLKLNPTKSEVLLLQGGTQDGALDFHSWWCTLDACKLHQESGHDPGYLLINGGPSYKHCQAANLPSVQGKTSGLFPVSLATVIHAMITSRLDYCNSL